MASGTLANKKNSKRRKSFGPGATIEKKRKQGSEGRSWLTHPAKKNKKQGSAEGKEKAVVVVDRSEVQWQGKQEQAQWLMERFKSASRHLSSLELDPIPDGSIVELSQGRDRMIEDLSWHIKNIFGQSWEEALCKGDLRSSKNLQLEAGSPALLVICSSANRCVNLLRGMRAFSSKCKPVKLFAKHIKIEEQTEALKGHTNIGAGTPNRIKKLMDMGALGLSRLEVVILDMEKDAKGLTLFTVPEVREEFWDLYRAHLHPRVLDRKSQICLY
ncbi:hypothetical protein O6H91_15G075900 [Diphasiastrum complanatum]|uniref:Uncharacterized protein n=1 Tax=Diphasiastrum complanatum TaxID=34168 RepID=A0ACC2BJR0_DIPCM|nr:hypothetical protein O6H91_15G075900 [Diphasiastrum complanatum]